jgi:hypothetical protein
MRASREGAVSREVLHAILGSRPLPRGQKTKIIDSAVRAEYDGRIAAGDPAMRIVADLAQRFACHPSSIRRSLRRTSIRR